MTMPIASQIARCGDEAFTRKDIQQIIEKTYPEREGFTRHLTRGTGKDGFAYCHIGYMTDRLKRCECGAEPVLEQTVDDVTEDGRNIPAQRFVAICPKCETRIEYDGDIEQCIEEWNAGKYTADSKLLKHSIKNRDLEAFARLGGKVVQMSYESAVALIKEKHRLRKRLDNPMIGGMEREACRNQIESINGELNVIQRFFEESPLMLNRDPESIISDIRKEVYPMLRPEMRMRKN